MRVKVMSGDGKIDLGLGKHVGCVPVYFWRLKDGTLRSCKNTEEEPVSSLQEEMMLIGATLVKMQNNPKIILDSGKVVYGCQVWWEKTEDKAFDKWSRVMKKTGSFILDLTEKHSNLKVEICITKTDKGFKRMVELFYDLAGQNNKLTSKTEAAFFGFLDNSGGFPNPIGLVILKVGFDTSTFVHELFHVARRYFKMAKIRINKEQDEIFAHLLSDLVDEFEKNISQ